MKTTLTALVLLLSAHSSEWFAIRTARMDGWTNGIPDAWPVRVQPIPGADAPEKYKSWIVVSAKELADIKASLVKEMDDYNQKQDAAKSAAEAAYLSALRDAMSRVEAEAVGLPANSIANETDNSDRIALLAEVLMLLKQKIAQ